MLKYGSARQATDNTLIWYMRLASWITKATDIHSEYLILTASYLIPSVPVNVL
jgi:hypothetical protein